MPFRDGTGPFGKGPKTGMGIGSCDLEKKPEFMFPMFIERPRWGLRRNLLQGFGGRRNRFRSRGRNRWGNNI